MNIVISGASSGVGFEAALALCADQGNKVIAVARSEDKLQRLSSAAFEFHRGSALFTLQFDIVSGNYKQELLPFIEQHVGEIDILINNAGSLINKPFFDLRQDDFITMFQSNFLGHFQMIQHLVPLMNTGAAHIVNIGSMGGFQGSIKFPGLAAYSASKAALHNLTECLALELEKTNIKVNCLSLGSAQTKMLEKAFPGYQSPVTATEMGKLVAEFAVNGSKFFNGKILPVSVTTP